MPIRYFLLLPFHVHSEEAQHWIRLVYSDNLTPIYFNRPLADDERVELLISIFKYKLQLKKLKRNETSKQ
jgi:hypothetical protein